MITYKKIPKDMRYLLMTYIFSILIWFLIFQEYNRLSLYYCILLTSGFIAVGSILTSIVSIDIDDNYFYKYIALTFTFIGVYNIVYALIEMFNIYGLNTVNKGTQITLFSTAFEIISFIISFKYINKKFSVDKFILTRKLIILLGTYIILRTNFLPEVFNVETGSTYLYYVFRILAIISYIYIIKTIDKNKDKIYIDESHNLKCYIMLRMSIIVCTIGFDVFTIFKPGFNIENLFLIICVIRFLTTYYMIKTSIIYGIKMPNIKLSKALKKEKEIAQKRNEILSNISHEFKTPINVIYSTIQMQDLNIKNNNMERMEEFNDIAKQNCNRLIRLINNFIDCSKFENKNFIINFKCVNIVSIVEDITMSVLPFAQNKNIELLFDTDEEELFCNVDIDFIERIILNLLSNAIKYNKENGSIIVDIKEKNDNVIITIKDTGIGIPKDKINSVFNRFDRIDRNLSRHKEGSGIGLNIVKQMVEHLNGTIDIDSIENEGTTVTIGLKKVLDENIEKYTYYNDILQKVELELSDI